MDRRELLQKLPPFLNRYTMVKKNQSVYDIVKEVLQAHEIFAPDYDRIASNFNYANKEDIANALFSFLKRNVSYRIEPEESQTTKSPSALLSQGFGDCKHYAGFIAGVLDALNRQGQNIDWAYRFASYNFFDKEPGHVFVIMHDDQGNEIWIDPVLKTLNERLEPVYILDKKPKQMLQRVSGISNIAADTVFLDDADRQLSTELLQAINLLYQFKVLSVDGKVNDTYLEYLSTTLNPDEFRKLADARALIHSKALSGFFSSVWDGIKTVTLSIPRTAFLSLVLLNFRNLAFKMGQIIFEGTTLKLKNDENSAELKRKWESLGGKWENLVTAVAGGRLKKEVIGATIGATQVAAWAVTAAAIIAAMTPIINNLVNKIGQESATMPYPYPNTTPYPNDNTGGGAMDFIQNNPLLIAAGAGAAYYFITKRKRKKA